MTPCYSYNYVTKFLLYCTIKSPKKFCLWRRNARVHDAAKHRHAISSRPKRCLAAQAGQGGLEHSPRASLIHLMLMTASEDQPSKASTTMGIKSMPAERQVDRWEESLCWVHTWSAWPGNDAAPDIVSCWRGEITEMSRAAWCPWLQLGRRMSAGHEQELGTIPEASLEGERIADRAALKRISRILLWRKILSPFPPHPTWSPIVSAWASYSGQLVWTAKQRNSQPIPKTRAKLLVKHMQAKGCWGYYVTHVYKFLCTVWMHQSENWLSKCSPIH